MAKSDTLSDESVGVSNSSVKSQAAKNNVYVSTKGKDSNDGSQKSPKATIKSALKSVNNNGNIYLSSGTYNEYGIKITKNVNIIGQNTKNTIINSKGKQTFVIESNVKIESLTIKNAKTTANGGAIYNKGVLKLHGIKIETSYARNLGGAIYNTGTLNIKKSSFSSNNAKNGGAIFNAKSLTVSRSTFNYNKAKDIGSAIYSINSAIVTGTNFTQNINSSICINKKSTITIKSASFLYNKGINGGAIYNRQSKLVIQKSAFKNNIATNTGGAIYSTGTTNIVDSFFSSNRARDGGAIISKLKLNIKDTTLRFNNATTSGGAIKSTGNIVIQTSTLQENRAKNGGALLVTTNKATKSIIQKSSFVKNTANTGAAAYIDGNTKLTIDYTTFTHNNKNALFIKTTSGSNKIYNSSFTNNQANNGGAIKVEGSTVTIDKCKFKENKATLGGAIYNYKAKTTITNSLILNNQKYDLYNTRGKLIANYNWWGTNNPDSSRAYNTTRKNNIYMTLSIKNSGTNYDKVTITASLNNIYESKTLKSYQTDKKIPLTSLNIRITGINKDENLKYNSASPRTLTRSYSKKGEVTVTAVIDNQKLTTSMYLKNIPITTKITSMYIQRFASVTKSDVNAWVKAGLTDVYVLTSVSDGDTSKLRSVASMCKNTNIRVHAWIICFKPGSSFDISYSRQTAVKNFIKKVIKLSGVDGVCLDYVRYSGSNPSSVNPNVITNFVKDVYNIVKSNNKNQLVNIAVFAEKGSTKTYYGQDYAALSPYVDVMLPMAYKYDYTPTRAWLKDVTNYVVKQAKYSYVVTTLQTYKEVGGSTPKLSTSEIEGDARAAMQAGSYGYCLFRYGLLYSYPKSALKL